MNARTGNYPPAAMRASDADRDAVVSDLSEHFQVGRLTATELDERTGRALAARTWGELRELLADLPAAGPALRAPAATSSSIWPRPPARRAAPPLIAALVGVGIAAIMLVNVAHGGWGGMWLLLPLLFIARRFICHSGASVPSDNLGPPKAQHPDQPAVADLLHLVRGGPGRCRDR
jgi:hypothetical protein